MAAFTAGASPAGLGRVMQNFRPKAEASDGKKIPPAWHNKQSKICVIGGGVGGVHISCLLKQAGYQNITIFESAPQLGGKCMSRFNDGVAFEMGFGLNIMSEGPNPLDELVREYGFEGQRIVIGESDCEGKKRAPLKMNRYVNESGDDFDANEQQDDEEAGTKEAPDKAGNEMFRRSSSAEAQQEDFKRSVSDLGSKIRDATSFSHLPPLQRLFTRKLSDIKEQVHAMLGTEPLVSAAKRYARLHRRLLGTYQYGMPPKPRADSRAQLNNMSFAELLNKHNLLSLVPVFILCPVNFTYQLLVELPAFVGLWWYNPTRVTALIDFQRGSLKVPEYTVLECGWQTLFSRMVEANAVPALVNTTVKSIRRGKEAEGGGHLIAYTAGEDRVKTYDFDLLIMACDLKAGLPLIEDATADERYVATALREFTLCSTVYEAQGGAANERPIELFPFPKRNSAAYGQVFAQINSRLLGGKAEAPSSGKERRVVYQFLNRGPRNEDVGMLKRRLRMYFEDQGIRDPVVLKQCPWKFFPHFGAQDIAEGWPWKLQEMQGTNGTLYVGAAACMESVNEILIHNASLVSSLGLH